MNLWVDTCIYYKNIHAEPIYMYLYDAHMCFCVYICIVYARAFMSDTCVTKSAAVCMCKCMSERVCVCVCVLL